MHLSPQTLAMLSDEIQSVSEQKGYVVWGTLNYCLDGKLFVGGLESAARAYPNRGRWLEIWPIDYFVDDDGNEIDGTDSEYSKAVAMRFVGVVLPAFSSGYETYGTLQECIDENPELAETFAADGWLMMIDKVG